MPILKSFPVRLKGDPTLHNALILRRMSLNLSPQHNPFLDDDDADLGGNGHQWSPGSSLLDGDAPRDRNPFADEEDENEANEGRRSGGGGVGDKEGSQKGSFKFSPLKALGKLGRNLRQSGRGLKTTPSPQGSSLEKKQRGRRSSEGSLLRLAGKNRDPSVTNGDLTSESECDSVSRRASLMKIVGLSKKKDSIVDRSSLGPEGEPMEEEEVLEVVKPREPLSVMEISQLVTKRDLLLADTHILELEQECNEAAIATAASDSSSPREEPLSPAPGSADWRRKAKDVELLYEALQKELWAVVGESLRSPTSGPNLGLVVQVLQQEEEADRAAGPPGPSLTWPCPRPRALRQAWQQAVGAAADSSLPLAREAGGAGGCVAPYLVRLKIRVLEDLGAARRNAMPVYPPEYRAFQVYVQSYHEAVSRRLEAIAKEQLQIIDIYSLLDWLYNIYHRDVLGTLCITSPFNRSQLGPLLPPETVDRLEQECLTSVRTNVTSQLSQLLEEEQKRWMETLHVEEFNISLASAVIQRLQVDLERSAEVSGSLGSKVAQCSLHGLADFLSRFQHGVDMFHEGFNSGMFGDNEDGYISKTIAMVNCCPPLRGLVQRCAQSDQQGEPQSEASVHKANSCLDHIISRAVRVLSDRLFTHTRPFFDKLVKRRWLTNTEPYEQIQVLVKQFFNKYRRMNSLPYQVLVAEVHRKVVVEYLRSIMRGRIICTSAKMRKRMAARLREEGSNIRALFKDLESPSSWLDSALSHISEMIMLEDIASIQMELGVLVREFPDIRKKHVSAILTMRGLRGQVERQEILNVMKDIESSEAGPARPSRERLLFDEVPVTSEVRCLSLGLSRLALAASSCASTLRPRRKARTPVSPGPDDAL